MRLAPRVTDPCASVRSGCQLAARHRKPLSREEARRALTDGGIRACEICRPDSEPGILD
ncbi:DUF6233 domain-containing protein [Streptomyces sp. NBC_00233]|uniref:DUF6233 domain-containing protein n=1 Tax=Streptomyces sp. NBC_00233 TaxID=2975686 RepID=UPI0033906C9C